GFPIAVSAAGSGEGDGAARVEAVSVIGYIAMLVGPPSLGFTGDAYGLRNAMVVVMLFVLAAAALSPGLQRR
ncbi:MFS transporter, partial [Klebsiella quasipneumoniae]|nr:MFS transporter [Klebsiella quasipneumoniae]